MEHLKIEYLPVDELRPYSKNARDHQQKSIDAIKSSIQKFGFCDAIGIWSDKNIIVEGHGRWLAAQELGIKEVPVVRLDHLTDEERRAYALAHNKTTEMSDWDKQLLSDELKDIFSINMDDFGFDLGLDIIDDAEAENDDYDIDTAYDQLPIRVHRGEIWQLGSHRLMCGDSTVHSDVSRLMDGAVADLLFTDPPYNVDYSSGTGMTIENDHMDSNSFYAFLNDAFSCAAENLKAGGAFYIWHADRESINFRSACEANGLMVKEGLIWNKDRFTLGRQDYKWKHEPCLYGWKEGAAHYFVLEFDHPTVIDDSVDLDKMKKEEMKALLSDLLAQIPTTIIDEKKPLKNDLHPTMKPITLCARLIKNSSKKADAFHQADIVLDLFGGSGSTLMACEQLGRICYMMEYDEKYATVIVDRWERLTGKTAIKL